MSYDTTPKPAMLRSFAAMKWTVTGAISELVDNSFGLGRGNATRCHVTYDPKQRRLTVLDNGVGMNPHVGKLFRFGDAIGRTPGDIGLYGSGGTMAILWLAEEVKVWTLRDGRVNSQALVWADYYDDDTFPAINDVWERARANDVPAELLALHHGSLIELTLRPERTFYASNVIRDLGDTYSPADRLGRSLIWTTIGKGGETHRLRSVVDTLQDAVAFDAYLAVPGNEELLGIRGEVGLVPGLPRTKSQVMFSYGPRVIFTTRDCFNRPDDPATYPAIGIAGYVDLREGWQPYMTLTKDEINSQPVRDALMDWIFTKIRHLLKEAEENDLQIILDDIALDLQRVLRRPAMARQGVGPGPIPGAGHSRISITPTQGPEIPSRQVEAPSSGSVFRIVRQTDADLEGRLCQVFRDDKTGAPYAGVNQEHRIVREALKAHPVNRMALEMLVTRELADLLSHDDALRVAAFRDEEREQLDAVHNNPQSIHRLLVDRVKAGAA